MLTVPSLRLPALIIGVSPSAVWAVPMLRSKPDRETLFVSPLASLAIKVVLPPAVE